MGVSDRSVEPGGFDPPTVAAAASDRRLDERRSLVQAHIGQYRANRRTAASTITMDTPLDATTRRRLLQALGVGAVGTALGTNPVTARNHGGGQGAPVGSPTSSSQMDPIFGVPFATPNPCGGDASSDCFDAFHPQSRPSHEVELHIEIPGFLFALAQDDDPSDETTRSLNEAVADGEFVPDDLHEPETRITVRPPGGSEVTMTVAEIAQLMVDTIGFHFDPAGIHVEPGDVVLFSAETPDHAVSAYHERHGRQNRVPDGVGPFSSPLIPVGGGWLFEFDEPGVYDCYCPPHEPFGMVHRVVVHDGGQVPSPSIEPTGRPADGENLLSFVLGGLDPNVPSAAEAYETNALDPENIVDEGRVSWHHVVEEHRENS